MKTSEGSGDKRAPRPQRGGMGGPGRGMPFGGARSFVGFDAAAKALGLTPTQLFEALHAGKSMEDIAKSKGVDINKVQEARRAAELAEIKTKLAQAVKDGKLTQAQADQALKDIAAGKIPGRGPGGPGGPPAGGRPPRPMA